MVFALGDPLAASDGWSAARIEESRGDRRRLRSDHEVPAEELLVAGRKYWTVGGSLDTLRERQSHLNTAAGRGDDPPKPPAGAGGGEPGTAVQDGGTQR
jgi:hypothetical protein